MLSARISKTTVPNIEVNMVWNGLLHSVVWLITAIGPAMMWRAGQKTDVPWSTRTLVGSLVQVWGFFNLV